MRFISLVLAAAISAGTTAAQLPADFNRGMIILNEGQFGKLSGTMTFIPTEGGADNIVYTAVRQVNPEKSLGLTSCFAQVYGNHIFVMSKQAWNKEDRIGGRFTALNATSLEVEASIETLPNGDGRGFCAVSEEKAYVGGSKGLYVLNLADMTFGDTQLAPANDKGTVQQTGDIIRYGSRVFAAQQNIGVVVIDIATDEVERVIELPKIAGFALLADGTLYAATSDAEAEFVKIDPLTLDTEVINIEGSHAIDSPWATWRSAAICADKTEPVVYYLSGAGFSPKKISSYNFATGEFNGEFFLLTPEVTGLSDKAMLYGLGLSIDPLSGNLMLNVNISYTDESYLLAVDPATGSLLSDLTVTLEPDYWFSSMMVYPDFTAPEFSLSDVELAEGETFEFNIFDATTLPVGNSHLIIYGLPEVDNTDVATLAEGEDGSYTLTAVAPGTAQVTFSADYKGRTGVCTFSVTVPEPEQGGDDGDDDENKDEDKDGISEVTVDSLDAYMTLYDLQGRQVTNPAPGLYLCRRGSAVTKILVK